MLVACRLAGLSALETYYARVRVGAQIWDHEGLCGQPLSVVGAARVHPGGLFASNPRPSD
jgi:hypothetical protein